MTCARSVSSRRILPAYCGLVICLALLAERLQALLT